MNGAVDLTAGVGLDGDQCIHVIPRQPPDIEAIPDELFAVCKQCESSGSVQFGVENCGQVQFVAQFPEAFFYCKYMYMYICMVWTHIDLLSVFYSS